MNEVVKYDNALNELDFKGFREHDLNLLMSLCARMRDMGESTQVLEYDYIMDLIEWDKRQRIDLFHHELMRMAEKLRHVGATALVNDDEFVSFNLFSTFRGNRKKKTLTIQVNKDFMYILNDLGGQFTRFELREYIKLDGKYPKLLYQHLKQFRKTGWWKIMIDDLRRDLSIPDSYKNFHIRDKVIKPSVPVLQSCKGFSDLTFEPIQSTGRGRALIGFMFKWTPEDQIPGQMTLDQAAGEMRRYKAQKKQTAKMEEQRDYDFADLEKQLLKAQVHG